MSEPLAEGVGAGTGVDANVIDDGAAVASPVVEAAPAFAYGDDPRFLEAVDSRAYELANGLVDQRLGPLEQMLREAFQAEQGGAPAPGELNPWEEGFGPSLDQRFDTLKQEMQKMVAGIAAPLAARQEAETVAEGNQRIQDMVADDISRNGDFPTDPETGRSAAKEAIRPLADMLFPAFAQRLGGRPDPQTGSYVFPHASGGPRAAEQAVFQATALVRQIVAEATQHASTTELNRLGTLAGANGDLGVNGAGVQTTVETRAKSLTEGLRSVTERHAAVMRSAQ